MIPDEAVEAAVSVAAKALFAEEEYGSEDRPDIDDKWLNFLSVTDREQYRRMARRALEAAAPHIASAAIADAADDFELPGSDATGYYSSEQVSGYNEAERHAESWLRARAEQKQDAK